MLIKSFTVITFILVGPLFGHRVSGQEISIKEEHKTIKTCGMDCGWNNSSGNRR